MDTKEFAIIWTNTNNRALPQLPKLCSILKIIAEDAQEAVEIAALKISEILVKQFPSFHCEIKNDEMEEYGIRIEITEGKEYVGKIYGFKVIA